VSADGRGEGVRSVLRTLDILDVLAEGPRSLGAIARAVRLPKTTVYRLLLTLEQREMVTRGGGDEVFRLGPRLLYLGLLVRDSSSLHEAALPVMRELRERFGETVNLNICVGDERLCIASLEGTYGVRMQGVMGERSPLHSGAAARAILAFLPSARIEAYIGDSLLTPVTGHTITDPERLRATLAEDRQRGYVVSYGERTEGVTSVGAPIWDAEREVVASLNVSGPSERMQQQSIDEIGEQTRQAALAVSARLGYVSTAVTVA
jgi:IclR family transcriptional regulator, KDG regulon repressor